MTKITDIQKIRDDFSFSMRRSVTDIMAVCQSEEFGTAFAYMPVRVK
jgi:hypothetical protein